MQNGNGLQLGSAFRANRGSNFGAHQQAKAHLVNTRGAKTRFLPTGMLAEASDRPSLSFPLPTGGNSGLRCQLEQGYILP